VGFAVRSIIVAMTLLAAATAQPLAAQTGKSCDASEYRQFDFWIGEWNVVETKTGAVAGKSKIESLYDGCGVRENWEDPELTGGSLNIYDKTDGKWHQFWIDSSGARREFIGAWEDGKMVLVATRPSTAHSGRTASIRMTFTKNADGSVRQYSDAKLQDDDAWSERYDYTYRRK